MRDGPAGVAKDAVGAHANVAHSKLARVEVIANTRRILPTKTKGTVKIESAGDHVRTTSLRKGSRMGCGDDGVDAGQSAARQEIGSCVYIFTEPQITTDLVGAGRLSESAEANNERTGSNHAISQVVASGTTRTADLPPVQQQQALYGMNAA